jgi:hypothetical protein
MAYSFADVAWYVHNRLASIESLNGIARTCSGIARLSNRHFCCTVWWYGE